MISIELLRNISNNKKRVKNAKRSRVFLTNFKLFGTRVKQPLEFGIKKNPLENQLAKKRLISVGKSMTKI